MEQHDSEAPQKPVKGSRKRPLWLRVLIYLIVAAILYSIIYVLFIHKNSSPGDNNPNGGGVPSGY